MLRIRRRLGKYEYVIEKNQVWLVRVLGIASIFSVACLAFGYFRFVSVQPLLMLLVLPFSIIIIYFMVNAVLMAVYPGFDSQEHDRKVHDYWRGRTDAPWVNVFIPAAGEPLDVVSRTVYAAARLDYPNKRVYILDDTPNGKYKLISTQACVGHINRPNTGQGKKSGNLNYALAHTPDSDHILVLDADFVPRKEMLHDMMPYAAPDVGIVQTPQHFETSQHVFAKSKVAYGAGYVQREFYRITQVARNRFGSAICVGTNALYNRRALDCIGGYAEVDHSEDVNTGLKMLNFVREDGKPFRIHYLPIQLASGECPDTYYGYYKQQNRWSTGSFRLVFSKRTLFSKVLRPVQKVIYFSNCLYYLYTIMILLMPLQFLALVLIRHGGYQLESVYCFLPQIFMRLIVMPIVFYQPRKRLATIVVTMCTSYTFAQALYLLIIGRPLGWEATGATGKPRHNRFDQLKTFVTLYFLLTLVGTLALAILNNSLGNGMSYLLQGLFVFSLISQAFHLGYLHLYGDGEKPGRMPRQAVASLSMVALLSFGVLGWSFAMRQQYDFFAAGNGPKGLVRQQDPIPNQLAQQ